MISISYLRCDFWTLSMQAVFGGAQSDLYVNESSNEVWIEGSFFIENRIYWDFLFVICIFDYFLCIILSIPLYICV